MTWIGHLGLRVARKNSMSKQHKSQLLVFMISIATDGMLVETDEEIKARFIERARGED